MELSVILSVRDGLAYTQQCIGILREYGFSSCELIVVDNGSMDGTAAWLRAQRDLKVMQGSADWGISRAYNEGRKKAMGDKLLFLHNDVVCSRDVIPALMQVLDLDGVAAAGPFTNRCKYGRQFVQPEAYETVEDFQRFAGKISHGGKNIAVNAALCLEGFCLMVESSAFDEVGGFDNRFERSGYESIDLSFRLLQAGYWLCDVSVYVHHRERSAVTDNYNSKAEDEKEQNMFQNKWDINLSYSGSIRHGLLKYIDVHRPGLSVLDLGCALGGNLMYLKWRNRSASLYGVELNPSTAAIAKHFGSVMVGNVESIDFEAFDGQFDYVIAGDLIEHLKNPWGFVKQVAGMLKPQGEFLASIPNVAHISNIYKLLRGYWEYTDAGLLDRTHLRFFTRTTIYRMFEEAGFRIVDCEYNKVQIPNSMQKLFNVLTTLPEFPVEKENLEAFQIFVRGKKIS